MFHALSILMLATAPATAPAVGDSLFAHLTDIHAVRLTAPITIDGVLNEPVWHQAEPVTNFIQSDPVQGAAPSQKTEVRVAYDDKAFYIGARMWDTAPDSIIARLVRRDVWVASDRFAIFVDPFHDRRTGYYFEVNAAGTLYDGTLFNCDWDESSWDGVWEGKAKRDDKAGPSRCGFRSRSCASARRSAICGASTSAGRFRATTNPTGWCSYRGTRAASSRASRA